MPGAGRQLGAIVLLAGALGGAHAQAPGAGERSAQGYAKQAPAAALFAQGKAALAAGKLSAAARDFGAVLVADPHSVPARVNLGVVALRRHEWAAAERWLGEAARLAPEEPGIRLDLGLAYFRQGEYAAAVAPFAAALARQDSFQARYLLGLCQFFTARYGDAVRTLAPLWPQADRQIDYLYVLGVAADDAHDAAWRGRALGRLLAVGGDTPTFHLLIGKAYLNHLENARAQAEFERAAEGNPRLPFVHFFLGVVYQRQHQFAAARREFEKDIALEPDVAYDYDHLGAVLSDLTENGAAAAAFRQALRRDPRLASSYYGLAKVELRLHRPRPALAALRRADRLSPKSASVHYLLGQAYLQAGDRASAASEFAVAAHLHQAVRDRLENEISGESLPATALVPETRR